MRRLSPDVSTRTKDVASPDARRPLHIRRTRARVAHGGAHLVAPMMPSRPSASSPRTEPTTVRSYDGREMPAEILRITVPEAPGTSWAHSHRRRVEAPGKCREPRPPDRVPDGRTRHSWDSNGTHPAVLHSLPATACSRGCHPRRPAWSAEFRTNPRLPVHSKAACRRVRHHRPARRSHTGTGPATCAEHWRAQDAEPTAYNTLESADDMDDLPRQSLGVNTIDLLAFSYGLPARVGRCSAPRRSRGTGYSPRRQRPRAGGETARHCRAQAPTDRATAEARLGVASPNRPPESRAYRLGSGLRAPPCPSPWTTGPAGSP